MTEIPLTVRVFDDQAEEGGEFEISSAEIEDGTIWVYVRGTPTEHTIGHLFSGTLRSTGTIPVMLDETLPDNTYELRDREGRVLGRFTVDG